MTVAYIIVAALLAVAITGIRYFTGSTRSFMARASLSAPDGKAGDG
jgi:hypothetical protein